MATARFMLDTNILLQCRDLPELPWDEVSDAKEIELYPAPTALFEIDRFKTSSDRKADRARLIFRRMRQAAIDKDQQIELRRQGPRLLLRIAPHLSDEDEQRVFGLPSADYRIVEEARILTAQLTDVCLLTNDTGPFLRAQRLGMKAQLVDEHWLLPREPSGTDRRLAALERQVATLASGGPIIEAELGTIGRADLLALPITEYGQLTPFSRDQLLEVLTGETLIDAEQRLQNRLRGRDDNIVIISVYAPEDYLADVKAWREEVRQALEYASSHAQIASRLHPFQLTIVNRGAKPAEHVKIKIESSGHVILASVAASARYWDADEQYPLGQLRVQGQFAGSYSRRVD